MDWFLWLCARAFFLGVTEHHIARGIARGSLPSRMQGFEKCDERRCLRRTQILPVCGHVAASLDHLADKLVLREPHGNAIQSRPSLPAALPEGVAVAALLNLKNERALALKRRCTVYKSLRHGIAAPSVHVRTPGSKSREMRKRSQRYRNQHDGQDRDRPPAPALFSFTRQEWKKKQSKDCDDRANEKRGSLQRRRQEREQCVEPKEEVIRFRHRLDDCRVRAARRTEWTEVHRAGSDRQEDERGKQQIFPYSIRNERSSILLRQFVVLGCVGRLFH